MGRFRASVLYYASLLVYFSLAAGLADGMARWLPILLAIVGLIIEILAMLVAVLLFWMYEEDWWNDFKTQHRGVGLGAFGSLAAVVLGAWFGLT